MHLVNRKRPPEFCLHQHLWAAWTFSGAETSPAALSSTLRGSALSAQSVMLGWPDHPHEHVLSSRSITRSQTRRLQVWPQALMPHSVQVAVHCAPFPPPQRETNSNKQMSLATVTGVPHLTLPRACLGDPQPALASPCLQFSRLLPQPVLSPCAKEGVGARKQPCCWYHPATGGTCSLPGTCPTSKRTCSLPHARPRSHPQDGELAPVAAAAPAQHCLASNLLC